MRAVFRVVPAKRLAGNFDCPSFKLRSSSFSITASFCEMMHNCIMRTTINLDEDVYELASLYANGRGMTLGAAIGELVRKAEAAPRAKSEPPRIRTASNGLPVVLGRGRAITPKMVKDAQEDDVA
jgi:hypothetical protein